VGDGLGGERPVGREEQRFDDAGQIHQTIFGKTEADGKCGGSRDSSSICVDRVGAMTILGDSALQVVDHELRRYTRIDRVDLIVAPFPLIL
jgi:hypothetical protein